MYFPVPIQLSHSIRFSFTVVTRLQSLDLTNDTRVQGLVSHGASFLVQQIAGITCSRHAICHVQLLTAKSVKVRIDSMAQKSSQDIGAFTWPGFRVPDLE